MSIDPTKPEDWSGRRVGLLGGSFNPAHEGHVAISEVALSRLDLDAVWWLVSPKNPLKEPSGLASFETRYKQVRLVAKDPRIDVTDLERTNDLAFTVETLEFLTTQFPDTKFVWLMGADCLQDFDKWKMWEKIIGMVPFAIFARPGYSIDALTGNLTVVWDKNRLPEEEAAHLADKQPPAWVYIEGPHVDVSATGIRKRAKAK